MPGGRSVIKAWRGGVDHLRFLPVGSVGALGTKQRISQDAGLGEIITTPLGCLIL